MALSEVGWSRITERPIFIADSSLLVRNIRRSSNGCEFEQGIKTIIGAESLLLDVDVDAITL
jgi:hypothetical protein